MRKILGVFGVFLDVSEKTKEKKDREVPYQLAQTLPLKLLLGYFDSPRCMRESGSFWRLFPKFHSIVVPKLDIFTLNVVFWEHSKSRFGGRKGQTVNFEFKTRQPKSLQKKGKLNKTTIGLITLIGLNLTLIGLNLDKNDYKGFFQYRRKWGEEGRMSMGGSSDSEEWGGD